MHLHILPLNHSQDIFPYSADSPSVSGTLLSASVNLSITHLQKNGIWI